MRILKVSDIICGRRIVYFELSDSRRISTRFISYDLHGRGVIRVCQHHGELTEGDVFTATQRHSQFLRIECKACNIARRNQWRESFRDSLGPSEWSKYRHRERCRAAARNGSQPPKRRSTALALLKRVLRYSLKPPKPTPLTREEARRRQIDQQNAQYRDDIDFRIKKRLRNTLRKHVTGERKEGALELVGCSTEELKKYLQARFKGRMSWSNYGRSWHIDHIIPLSSFDLKDEQQRKRAFHFTNLQPLWRRENIRKHAKITDAQFRLML